jgi:DNA-binding NarL/FixJ family response regulator
VIGRGDEQAALATLAAPDDGRTLVLRGEPGVGKSTLVDWTLERARENGTATVRIAGVEGDAGAPNAGIAQLCAPFADLLPELPATAAATLRTALDSDGGDPPPRLALGVALTALLGLATEPQPLLVAVDDVQWLDAESLDALLFAARRLGDDPLALLIATRSEAPRALLKGGLPLLEIGNLGADDAWALVRRAAGSVSPRVTDAIVAAGGGNPLALRELVRGLSPDQLSGRLPLPDPLGGDGVAAAPFRARLAALPTATLRALTVAAAESSGRADLVGAALAELGLTATDLQPAELEALIEHSGPSIVFTHPLCRAAAYDGAGPGERAATHRALANAHAAAGDPVVRAEHLAKATELPDEQIAAELEQAAELARQRAAPSLAARLALRAAELSPADADRVRRTLAAGWLLPDTAHGVLAPPAIEAALPLAEPLQHAELVRALANAYLRLGRFERAREVVLAEAEWVAADAPATAGWLIVSATARHVVLSTYRDELADAERVRQLGATAGDGELTRAAELVAAHASATLGDTDRARELLDAHEAALGSLPLGPTHELAIYPADAALWSDRLDLADRVLERPIRVARQAGDVAALIYPLTVRARLRLRRAELRAAEADARDAVRLATDSAQTGLLALALSVLAQVEAVAGPADSGRSHAGQGIALGERIGNALVIYPKAALGRIELAVGRPAAAVEPLLWCDRYAAHTAIGNPEVSGSSADLVEALAAEDRLAEARAALDGLDAAAARSGSRWAAAVAIRCRAQLATDDEIAVALLHEAIAAATDIAPFDAARARLTLGRRLRSAGDRDAAAAELRRAEAELRRIGATLWAEQAAAELPPGEREPATADPLASLTPLEEQIARLAADGLTNPEIGERLFYSRKTIERRLSAIFAKLAVRSRTELARTFDDS